MNESVSQTVAAPGVCSYWGRVGPRNFWVPALGCLSTAHRRRLYWGWVQNGPPAKGVRVCYPWKIFEKIAFKILPSVAVQNGTVRREKLVLYSRMK